MGMTFEQWKEKYEPNTFENLLILYETYGEWIKFIKEQPANHVWTLLETDGERYIVSGIFIINREGYFICKNAWEEKQNEDIWIEPTDEDLKDLYYTT